MHQLLGNVFTSLPPPSFDGSSAGAEAPTLRRPNSSADRYILITLVGLLVLSLAVQVLSVFHSSVNWDEFIFLSNIYGVANGYAVGLLQTPYTHLFGWLTRIGGDEITQITLGRLLFLIV